MDQKASPAALNVEENNSSQAPEVIALQPLAVVDHLCSVTEDTLKSVLAQEEIGGSRRISQQQVQDMLAQIGEFHSKAGGSNANTIRGLAAGFGVQCELVGARGYDEWGAMFASSMKRSMAGVSFSFAMVSAQCVLAWAKQPAWQLMTYQYKTSVAPNGCSSAATAFMVSICCSEQLS